MDYLQKAFDNCTNDRKTKSKYSSMKCEDTETKSANHRSSSSIKTISDKEHSLQKGWLRKVQWSLYGKKVGKCKTGSEVEECWGRRGGERECWRERTM